ncbi:MAG TPA: hypothetical protein VMU50_10660 [Polyangia bacterium]|nr:hypothetical protein [Polyangia bacterium]
MNGGRFPAIFGTLSAALAIALTIAGCVSSSAGGGTGGAGGGGGGGAMDAPRDGVASGGATGEAAGTGTGGAAVIDAGMGGSADADADLAVDARAPSDSADATADATGLAQGRHTARPLGTMPGAKIGYWEYLPRGYGDGTKRPLLVFWHGSGEEGTGSAADLMRILANGPPKLIAANQWPADRPFIVLSPQHNQDCFTLGELQRDFLNFAMSAYDVDLTRVYQTGLSCGAVAITDYIARIGTAPMAAAVLISGIITPAWTARGCSMASDLALWVFHNNGDPIAPPEGDATNMPKLIACPQPPRKDVRYTVYTSMEHDAWTRTYDLSSGNDIYAWLLAQHR